MSEFFILLIFFVVLMALWGWFQVQQEEKEAREKELRKIALKVQGYVVKINESKSNATRRSNCEKALIALRPVSKYKDYDSIFKNYHEVVNHLKALEKVLPVCDYLDRADRHRFKGKDRYEKNALLDALYQIETNSITDTDFVVAEVTDDSTGEVVTISNIESRLKKLGWTKRTKTG